MLPRAFVVTLLAFASIAMTTAARYEGSPPRPRDAPAETFSVARSTEILRELLGDGSPHPVGSEANARVRARIVAELERSGYAPQVQTAFACGKHGSCGFVQNVVARLDGREEGASVLVSAHYDSVGAGPGANDDGSGVASVLEIARALKAGPVPRHPIVFLLDDGEEGGLLGAEAFAREHPWMRDVRAAVNLDARGSSGPSMMFETSPENRWIVDLMAASLPRPVTSSLYYAIYQRMPNDTDLTVWKRTAHGVNFAFTGSVEHYHTPLDRLENTRPATLQQHGENGLAMARAFADADIAHPPPGDAVWFDVLASFVVRWPEAWTLPIAISAFLLVVFGIFLRKHDGAPATSGVAVGAIATVLTIGAGAVAAFAIGIMVQTAGALPAPWIANGAVVQASLWAGAIAAGTCIFAAAARLGDPASLSRGTWLAWAVLGLGAVAVLPGASFLFVVPALVAGLAGLFPRSKMAPAALAAATAACIWIPVLWLLYGGIGVAVPAAHGAAVAMLLTTLFPLVATLPERFWGLLAKTAAAATVVLTAIACLRPPFSPGVPQRTNVVFHQDEGARDARWLVDATWGGTAWGTPPEAMRKALGEGARDEARFAWSPQTAAVAPAPHMDAPPPELALLSTTAASGRRTLHARLFSPRGAPTLVLVLPPLSQVTVTRAEGVPVVGPRSLAKGGWRTHTFLGVPPRGVELDLDAPAEATEITLLDQTPGVPAGGNAILAARPENAVPTQDGDVTILTRRQRL